MYANLMQRTHNPFWEGVATHFNQLADKCVSKTSASPSHSVWWEEVAQDGTNMLLISTRLLLVPGTFHCT